MLKASVKKALLEALSKAHEGPTELAVDGNRVKVTCAVLPTIRAGQTGRLRLRFDKVVLRLMRALKVNLDAEIPEGHVVLVTLAAPIRLPGKTSDVLQSTIRSTISQRNVKADIEDTIHGNPVRIRLVNIAVPIACPLVLFVHNPDTDSLVLLDAAKALLERIGTAERSASRIKGQHWLVLIAEEDWELYCLVYSQLAIASAFNRIILASRNGTLDELVGGPPLI